MEGVQNHFYLCELGKAERRDSLIGTQHPKAEQVTQYSPSLKAVLELESRNVVHLELIVD
jgi:hypothetical protein